MFANAMQIEKARAEDAPTLTHIALAAKRHWGYPDAWIEKWRPELEIAAAEIEKTETYRALIGTESVGFYRLTPKSRMLELEHIWVLPSQMGKGVGRRLFEHAVQRTRALGFRFFEIQADPNASGFYDRMGCVRTGTVVNEIDGCRHELPLFRYEI